MQVLKSPSDIQASGDWSADNAAGRQLADAYIADARTRDDPCPINGALRSIANAGRWTGVEVGFSFTLAIAAMGAVIGAAPAPRFNWVVGWNIPGCLPDAEPMDCETWESARDSLIWELERLDCHGPEIEAEADSAIAELRAATPDQEITTRAVMGYVSWIAAAETPFSESAQ